MRGIDSAGVSMSAHRAVSSAGMSRDYLVTTMGMRNMVLSARPKSRRIIKYKRSAPSFQNRTLENFPMPHGREDAVRSAKGHRKERRDTAQWMSRSRVDSGSMRDYSKQMFDFSIHSANNNTYPSSKNRGKENERASYRSKSLIETRPTPRASPPASRTNGPTPDGSILHNRKQMVLNDIRTRPHHDYTVDNPARDGLHSRQSLQETIREKNRNYRVLSVSGDSRPQSNTGPASISCSDYIFIPKDAPHYANHNRLTEEFPRVACDTALSIYTDADSDPFHYGDPFEDAEERSVSLGGDFRPLTQSTRPNSVSTYSVCSMLPPTTPCGLRLVSLDEVTSSESEPDDEPPEVKPEPPPPPAPKTGREKTVEFEDERGKNAIPEPEPEPEPVKVKLVLKGPHCWVDDVTVSSDQSERGDPDNPDDDVNKTDENAPQSKEVVVESQPPPTKLDLKATKTKSLLKNAITANKKQPPEVTTPQNEKKNPLKETFLKGVQASQISAQPKAEEPANTNVIPNGHPPPEDNATKEDVQEEEKVIEPKLPDFICPSSERKSREAALKHWLATTCFPSAHKEIPIL